MIRKIICLLVLVAPPAFSAQVTINDVPAYLWYHGCGPTAAGSVLGYWDLHGYANLFSAAGKDVFYTPNVQNQISSPEHNEKYETSSGFESLAIASMTSIADYFETSVNLPTGWSSLGKATTAFTGYSRYRGYEFNATTMVYGDSLWKNLVESVNQGHPSMFLVDYSGDGITDHFVPVLGYDDRGADGLWYGYYTTWSEDETLQWSLFRGISRSYGWGVYASTFVDPISAPTPIPATMLLLGSGLAMLAVLSGRRLKK